MKLIVESGSTKTDWVAVDDNFNVVERTKTTGLNPAILTGKKVKKAIKKNEYLQSIRTDVDQIFFYGAGCGTQHATKMLKKSLKKRFTNAKVKVKEDTYAAIYASIDTKDEAAVVCILGTGSNCSYYDGKEVHQTVTSLGYSIMDDASGNYFGKQLLRGYFYHQMPTDLKLKFAAHTNLDPNYVKHQLYKEARPNAYLASLASFIVQNKNHEYCKAIIIDGLQSFSDNFIGQYKNELDKVKVHFVGSISHFLQDEILEVAKANNFTVGNITQKPVDRLIAFHKKG